MPAGRSRTVSIFSSELGEANKRSVYFKHSSRVSNPILVRTIKGCVSACDSNDFKAKILVDTNNANKRGNKASTFFSETTSTSHIFSSKERFRAEASNEFEEHISCSFKDEKAFSAEGIAQENNYVWKIDLKNRYFSVPLSPEPPKAHKVQMERSNLSFYLPVIWSGVSTKGIYKASKNSHFSVEKTQCMSYNIYIFLILFFPLSLHYITHIHKVTNKTM